jgi:hypothetical protein
MTQSFVESAQIAHILCNTTKNLIAITDDFAESVITKLRLVILGGVMVSMLGIGPRIHRLNPG